MTRVPITTRSSHAAHDAALTWLSWKEAVAGSSAQAAAKPIRPPSSHCAPEAMAGAGCDSLREAYEPRLQHSGAPKAHKVPCQVAEKSPSSASTAAPATPSTRPSQLVTGTRSPPRRDHSASHMGMVVTTVAMSPEPMPSFCASTTMDMAPKAISPPTSAVCRHWAALGQGRPWARATASITPPANTKRAPFMSKGGMDAMATPRA